jgi:hypothetical protein
MSGRFPQSSRNRFERRRSPRLDALGQVHVHIATCPVPASLREIGPGGFSVETTTPFPPGQTHEFHFGLDDGSEIHVQASSVHCALTKIVAGMPVHLNGFEFVQRDADVREEIDAFVDRITAMIAVA